MARKQTEVTELAVALGLLGYSSTEEIEELIKDEEKIRQLFQGTATATKLRNVVEELVQGAKLYRQTLNLLYLGFRLRQLPEYSCLFQTLQWTGGLQQAQTLSMPKDIVAGLIAISVKMTSNVVANPSPENLFHRLPAGKVEIARSKRDWFLEVAPSEYRQLYKVAKQILRGMDMPEDLETFLGWKREQRKQIGLSLSDNNLTPEQKRMWKAAYLPFVDKVSQRSAEIFMENYRKARRRGAVHEMILRKFFRLDACPYLFCGVDSKEGAFAFEVPDLTTWSRRYKLRKLEALADKRAQPAVRFVLTVEDRGTGNVVSLFYHSEIRWSHRRFVANPEAKLYKDVGWKDIPGLRQIEGWGVDDMKKLTPVW